MSRASCDCFFTEVSANFFWPTLLKRFSCKGQKANIFDRRIAQASKGNFAEDHNA